MSWEVYDPEKDVRVENDIPRLGKTRQKESFLRQNRRHMILLIDIAILAVFAGVFIPFWLDRSREVDLDERVFKYKAVNGEELVLVNWSLIRGQLVSAGEEILFSYYTEDDEIPVYQDVFKAEQKMTEHSFNAILSGKREILCVIENKLSGDMARIKIAQFE